MAEEFADFILELNKKPLKEQVKELRVIIGTLVQITENFINYYDMEHSIIHNKIIALETKQLNSKLPKIEVLSVQPPPPPPQQRPIGDKNIRFTVMKELKGLFEKREELNGTKELKTNDRKK